MTTFSNQKGKKGQNTKEKIVKKKLHPIVYQKFDKPRDIK